MNEKQEIINQTINKKDADWLNKIQKQERHDIRGYGAQVWRPRNRKIVCEGCIYKGEPLKFSESRGSGFNTYMIEDEVPVCNKPDDHHIVRWPYEMCKNRLEKPKIPIDQWK